MVGVTDIRYPVAYRGYEPEHDDPFFDRDYNSASCAAAACGCARRCAAPPCWPSYTGPRTLIGPAFGRNHVEAGCEFCGACVSVCPTGALADKVSKWDGTPDGIEVSTCPFCPLGCQVELRTTGAGSLSVHGARDPRSTTASSASAGGSACPRRRTIHEGAAGRAAQGRYFRVVGWDEALEEVARDWRPCARRTS